MLSNGSVYNIYDIKHIVNNNLIFSKPIPSTNIKLLEELYNVIFYTTQFLEINNIDYCIESGTLLGAVRHQGIIPRDNDIDIMIFKDGYYKLLNYINNFKNDKYELLHCTPGFKIFYNKKCYGELFVYDYDININKYRMAYPYINNIPTFITGKIYYDYEKFNKDDIFPTQIISFEDFKVRAPNNIIKILQTIYSGNLLYCHYNYDKNEQYESIDYNKYKLIANIEKNITNKIFIYIHIILHYIISKFMIKL